MSFKLEIVDIHLADDTERPADLTSFVAPLLVEIREKGQRGVEIFHFVAASPAGLADDVNRGEFHILRGYILIQHFDWDVIYRAVQNVLNHTGSCQNWDEAIAFLSRYCRYDYEGH
jgi:hypothetical protein